MIKTFVVAAVAATFSLGALAQASAPSGKMSPPSTSAKEPMKSASGAMKAEKHDGMKKEHKMKKGASAPA